jgi:hypothetical protein
MLACILLPATTLLESDGSLDLFQAGELQFFLLGAKKYSSIFIHTVLNNGIQKLFLNSCSVVSLEQS